MHTSVQTELGRGGIRDGEDEEREKWRGPSGKATGQGNWLGRSIHNRTEFEFAIVLVSAAALAAGAGKLDLPRQWAELTGTYL